MPDLFLLGALRSRGTQGELNKMSRRRKTGGNSLDVVQRLQQRVSEGEFYEALQLYKTSYSRLKAQGRLDDAEELITTGAIAMSKENEVCTFERLMCAYMCSSSI